MPVSSVRLLVRSECWYCSGVSASTVPFRASRSDNAAMGVVDVGAAATAC
jgi:hypothetical protein